LEIIKEKIQIYNTQQLIYFCFDLLLQSQIRFLPPQSFGTLWVAKECFACRAKA